jgi:hypothetical protein
MNFPYGLEKAPRVSMQTGENESAFCTQRSPGLSRRPCDELVDPVEWKRLPPPRGIRTGPDRQAWCGDGSNGWRRGASRAGLVQ